MVAHLFTRLFIACGLLLSTCSLVQAVEGDATKGQQVFEKCRACHVADAETNKIGPHLVGIIGRTPASVVGYRYSKAMKLFAEENTWDKQTLATYLAAPARVVRGTRMAFVGLKRPDDIDNLIAYLEQLAATATDP